MRSIFKISSSLFHPFLGTLAKTKNPLTFSWNISLGITTYIEIGPPRAHIILSDTYTTVSHNSWASPVNHSQITAEEVKVNSENSRVEFQFYGILYNTILY